MKKCCCCKEIKDESDFGLDKSTKTGLNYRCKKCNQRIGLGRYYDDIENNREKGRARARKNKKRLRDTFLRRMYGLTSEEYEQKLEKQEHRCAICGKKDTEQNMNMAVDHDHKTNKVRGLLCDKCNRGLGYFLENPESLRSAADYIEAHKDA